MAVEPIPTLLDSKTGPTTDAYQKAMNDYATHLLKGESPRKPGIRYTWANGLNDAAGNMLGAWMLKKARDQQLNRNQSQDNPGGMLTAPVPGAAASGGAVSPGPLALSPLGGAIGTPGISPTKPNIWDPKNMVTWDPSMAGGSAF